MTKVCVIDFETSIGTGVHKGLAKDPNNDFYTIIWGSHPDEVKIAHSAEGFKRDLGPASEVLSADVVVGHNLPFDLSYIIHHWTAEARMPRCWDTQIAEYLMTGQRHQYASLAELQSKYLGQKIKKDRISRLYAAGIGADKIVAACRS